MMKIKAVKNFKCLKVINHCQELDDAVRNLRTEKEKK